MYREETSPDVASATPSTQPTPSQPQRIELGYTITPVRNTPDLAATTTLFRAYAASLPFDLDFQDFSTELSSMPGKYVVERGGELLLARMAGRAVGCVALRRLSADCCEMKRLFVAEDGRGLGVGKALSLAIIRVAEEMGYAEIKLDTLPSMERALAVYFNLGFVNVAPYYETPLEGTQFLSLELPRRNVDG